MGASFLTCLSHHLNVAIYEKAFEVGSKGLLERDANIICSVLQKYEHYTQGNVSYEHRPPFNFPLRRGQSQRQFLNNYYPHQNATCYKQIIN